MSSSALKSGLVRNLEAQEAGRKRAGELVVQSGIYRVYHRAHRLPHNVYVNAGTRLPLCQRCGRDVEFGLIAAGPDLKSDYDFSYHEDEALA